MTDLFADSDTRETPPAAARPIAHPPADFEPLESYEQDPGDAPGPDAADPDAGVNDYIRLAAGLYASGAGQAFIERRLQLQREHGALAKTDLSNSPLALARSLHERATALIEGLGGRGAPSRETIDAALARLVTVGAVALALHDRLTADRATARKEDA